MRSDLTGAHHSEENVNLLKADIRLSRTNEVVMSGTEYLQDPEKALRAMERGLTVVVESIVGGARLVLSGAPLSAIHLDDTKP